MELFTKKRFVWTLLIIYILSYFLHELIFIDFQKAFAEDTIQNTNLVAVIVDQEIYNSPQIKNNIEWYATNYIQQKIADSIAIVLPINKDNFKAPDIVRILENMYFDGIKDQPSKLAGLVLIGDIPLPVVESNNFVYPSIYPYVDFEDQQFIYNADKGFFVYNDNPNGQAEIWHGIINYNDDIAKYKKFFAKLIDYNQHPEKFIDAKIRYDDFVATKENFLTDNITYYVNNFLFTEDVGYHRFTNLLLGILKGEHNKVVSDAVTNFTNDLPSATSTDPDEAAAGEYGGTIQKLMDEFNKIMGEISEESNKNASTTADEGSPPEPSTPTLTLAKLTNEFLKTYDTLLSTKYLTRIRDNVQTAARRYQPNQDGDLIMSFDSHYNKIVLNDTLAVGNSDFNLAPVLIEYNNQLESMLNEKVKSYAQNIEVLTKVKETTGKKKQQGVYENFYFGKKASDISSAQEFSIYRGTYQNLDSISGITYFQPSDPLRSSISVAKTIGGSYKIFSQQIEANRGYNLRNTESDLELFNDRKGGKRYESPYYNGEKIVRAWKLKNGGERKEKNNKKRYDIWENEQPKGSSEEGDEIINKNWGGATPLNLGTNGKLKWFLYTDAWKPIYDIAGSVLISNAQPEANSYAGHLKYASVIRTQLAGGDVADIYPRARVEDGDGRDQAKIIKDIYGNEVAFVHKTTLGYVDFGYWGSNNLLQKNSNHEYTYKNISSIVYNISPTPEQINGLHISKYGTGSPLHNLYDDLQKDIQYQKDNLLNKSGFISTMTNLTNKVYQTDTVTNTSTSTIVSYSQSQVDTLANDRENINNNIIASDFSNGTNSITNDLTELDELLISTISRTINYYGNNITGSDTTTYSTPFTVSSIPAKIQQYLQDNQTADGFFKFSPGSITFLSGRKSNLLAGLTDLQNSVTSFKSNFDTFQNNYNSTTTNVSTKINSSLENKKTAINQLIDCDSSPSFDYCGCRNGQKYYNLCVAIDHIKTKLNDIKPLLDNINKLISKTKDIEKNYFNNYGDYQDHQNNTGEIDYSTEDSTGSYSTYPFNAIDLGFSTHSTNAAGITASIAAAKSTINGISTIPDSDASKYQINTAGMDMTTQERPIDNIRNVTFKSVGGSVKFNYPNLYEVETFNLSGGKLILKTTSEIEQSIKTYLQNKVDEYNAQPINPKIDANYFITRLTESTIKDIAKLMYYQNITRQEKQPMRSSGTIQDDINLTKSSFDINKKTSYIVQNYLKSDNNQGPLITPTYSAGGYEVAFINSDGQDYVKAKPIPTDIQEIITLQQSQGNKFEQREKSDFEKELDDECNFDPSGSELIFDIKTMSSPWLKAFDCRLKQTAKKPFDIKIDFSNALGPTLSSFIGEVDQSLENRQGSLGQYSSQWSALNTESANTESINNAPDLNKDQLTDIMNYSEIRFTAKDQDQSTSWQLGDQTTDKKLQIFSTRDIGKFDIKISATGDNCFGIKQGATAIQNNLCNDRKGVIFNPYSESKSYDVILSNKAGTTVVVVSFCMPGSTIQCVKKASKIEILPDALNKVTINSPTDNIIAGGEMPLTIDAQDIYGNSIGLTAPEVYLYTLDGDGQVGDGTFANNTLSFSDFKKTNFIYTAPSDVKNTKQATIYFSGINANQQTIIANKKINVIKGYLDIYYGGDTILKRSNIDTIQPIDYSLSSAENISGDNTSDVPKIVLSLKKDNGTILKEVESIALVSVKNGLLIPGTIIDKKFKKNGNFIIKDGSLTIYLYPSFKAGDDILNISIPGIDPIQIPIHVLPGNAKKVIISSDIDTVVPNQTIGLKIKVTDPWDNTLQNDTTLNIGTIGSLTIDGLSSKEITVKGESDLDIQTKEPGGEGYIFAYIKNRGRSDQSPGYLDILIQNNLLPGTGLNIMYLNLLGTDRGNQRGYFSNKSGYVTQLMDNSDKLLAVTTQLIDPSKLRLTDVIVTSHAQIKNLGEKEINLTTADKELLINITDIGSISLGKTSDFALQKIENTDDIDSILNNRNLIAYLPQPTDSIITTNTIKNKSIIINGDEEILNLSDGTIENGIIISLSTQKIDNYSIRNIIRGDKLVGQLFINRKDDYIIQDTKTNITNIDYDTKEVFAEASTNGVKGIGFYDTNSSFATQGYKSVEDNADSTIGLGFTSNYKNVTYFGNGKSVGESTLPFGSQFLINYGDPLLTKVSQNTTIQQTDFDGGLGDPVYSDPTKTIFKVIPIDFNNDGLNDIITVYTDGTIKILKNYGGDHPYRNMQNLMVIADSIKDVIVGDIDGSKEHYPEIIIRTTSNKLKVYKNNKGIFDVDGYLACLNINTKPKVKSAKPDDISQANQIFFEDMDKDGNLDIITNDNRNDIKIFYGGSDGKGNANYLSTLKYTCDPGRYDRQKNNINLVKNIGLKINDSSFVQDQSIVHRQGLIGATGSDLGDTEPTGVDSNTFSTSLDGRKDGKENKKSDKDELEKLKNQGDNMTDDAQSEANNFINNLDGYINQGIQEYNKYVTSPTDILPIYEKDLTQEQILYAQSSNLLTGDNVSIYKQYKDINGDILEAGDIITVTTTIGALKDGETKLTYLENIQLPPNSTIEVDEDNQITSLKFLTNKGDLTINQDIGDPYDFMLDNIKLNKNEKLQFSYDFIYGGTAASTIDVFDEEIKASETVYAYNLKAENGKIIKTQLLNKKDKDGLPDIIAYPTNSCKKNKLIILNTNKSDKKSYEDIFFDIQKKIDEDNAAAAKIAQDNLNKTIDTYTQPTDLNSIQNIPGIDQVFESRTPQGILSEGGGSINIDTEFLNQATAQVQNIMDEALKGACQGFKIGKNKDCQGIPVPFNQAFLAPGNYHLFGCTKLSFLDSSIGKGIPIISFPTNCTIPIWPPCPSGAGGIFGGSSSQFRVYAVPTLTMGMGIAICIGPYSLGKSLPKPFRDIGGNCVVFSIPPITKCKDTSDNGGQSNQILDNTTFETAANGACNNPPKTGNAMIFLAQGPTLKATDESPFTITAASEGEYSNPPLREGNFFGLSLDQKPTKIQNLPTTTQGGGNITTATFDFGGGERFELKAGEKIDNKVLSSIKKGLIKCIMEDRLDKQILYLANNLTKFTISFTLPNFSQLGQGFDKLNEANLGQLIKEEYQKDTGANIGASYNQAKQAVQTMSGKLLKEAFSRQMFQNVSNTSSNPFDAIKTLFKEVPLININTKDINIKIPTIGSEEITKYLAYLKTRSDTNTKILLRWIDLINNVLGYCGTVDKKEATATLPDLQKEKTDIQSDTLLDNASKTQLLKDLDKEIGSMQYIIDLPQDTNRKKLGSDTKLIGKNLQLTFERIGQQNRLEASKNILTKRQLNASDEQRLQRTKTRLEKVNQCGDFVNGLGNFFTFYENTAQLTRSIKSNIKALEQYKKFPLQLYEWIHVTDRYLTEISSIFADFVGTINNRMDTNATRFSKYVDAIILLMGVMKTRQVLIDFSANRSKKCGKCTNDDYGSQSCSLSFLCPKLPILKIPNFKIPSLYIDFSHINLGIDITLPNFNFKPMTITLPQIPNLPDPPQFEVYLDYDYGLDLDMGYFDNLTVPTIPILPSPPQLPELPSFIPNVKLQLPVIPPAPKIPKISPKIEISLKIAEFIGRIYCIMKGGIGLVGEKGVKQKIEQMTQRTWDVPIFDYFDLTYKFKEEPLKGFDYKLDAYLDLKYNFDGFYSFLNNIAGYVNNFSNEVQGVTQQNIDQGTQEMRKSESEMLQEMEKYQNINVNINSYIPNTEELPTADYTEAKEDLQRGLTAFQNKANEINASSTIKEINQISAQINKTANIKSSSDQLNSIQNQVQTIIQNKKIQTKQLTDLIQDDYPRFVKSISDNGNKLVKNENFSMSISSPLLIMSPETSQLISSQPDPTQTYINLNKKVLDGYIKALDNGSPETLNMTQNTYDKSKEYLLAINDKITSTSNDSSTIQNSKFNIQNSETTQSPTESLSNLQVASKSPSLLLAQNTCTNCEASKITSSSTSNSYSPDLSQFINGIFVDALSGDERLKINVVKSDENVTKIGNNYKSYDINKDGTNDIIMRDDNNIYIKYAYKNKILNDAYGSKNHESSYYTYEINSPAQLSQDSNLGYISIRDIKLKLTDNNLEVKNFKMQGQDFESIKFSWTNSDIQGDQADGYLIRLNQRVDTFHDKAEKFNYELDEEEFNKKYVLVLPNGSDITGTLISLKDGFADKKPLKSLLTGTVIEIKFFDPSQDKINISLIEIPRTWQYAQIATLTKAQDKLSKSQASKLSLYEIQSPRSNQIVAGRQLIADSIGPVGEFTLYRPQIDQTVYTGEDMAGFVSTHYNINANWTDNVAVQAMRIEKNGEIIKLQSGFNQTGFISLTGLFFTGSATDNYYFGAQDFNGNVTREQITLNIKVPDISILNVNKLDNDNGQIIAQIENDLDEGNVVFQRYRNNIRKEMTGTQSNSYGGFGLTGNQTIITGQVFSIGNTIGFYNIAGDEIGSLNSDNGKILIKDTYIANTEIKLDLSSHIPITQIIDKTNGNTLFQINLPTQEIAEIQMKQGTPNYEKITLPESNFGIFNGGYCIKSSDDNCIIYIGLQGQVYIPSPYNSSLQGTYDFDNINQNIIYQITDQANNQITNIHLKFKPNTP